VTEFSEPRVIESRIVDLEFAIAKESDFDSHVLIDGIVEGTRHEWSLGKPGHDVLLIDDSKKTKLAVNFQLIKGAGKLFIADPWRGKGIARDDLWILLIGHQSIHRSLVGEECCQ